MARKTFNVSEFKDYVNSKLVLDHLSDDQKYVLLTALDYMLHKTGNYNGFMYVFKDDVRPCFEGKVGAEARNPDWDMNRDVRRKYI